VTPDQAAEPERPVRRRRKPPVRYLSNADIAAGLGVPVLTVKMWRGRYSPGRPAGKIRRAPSFPLPDVLIGMEDPAFGNSTTTPGWLPSRMPEIRAWRESLPGQGAGGGRKPPAKRGRAS